MAKYKQVEFPPSRITTLDMGDLKDFRNHVMGFLELDVTDARQNIRELRQNTGKSVSLTAWLIKAICAAIGEYPMAAGYLAGKRKAIVFDSVDIAMLVERTAKGYPPVIDLNELSLLKPVLQASNHLPDLHARVAAALREPAQERNGMSPGSAAAFLRNLHHYLQSIE